MTNDTLNTLGKYLIAAIALIGCFALLWTGRSSDPQVWTVIGLIIGWVVRDSAGTAATSNAVKTLAAVTTSSVPSATLMTADVMAGPYASQ